MKKTKGMITAEQQTGQAIDKLIPMLVRKHGLRGAAKEVGIHPGTMSYWMLKLDLNYDQIQSKP